MRYVKTIVVALVACAIALPATASADQPCDLKTHSVQPQTGSCVPVTDDATTIEVVRPERTIVRNVDEALPLILSGIALVVALAGGGLTLVRTGMLPGRSH
jgi:hypothetical protein